MDESVQFDQDQKRTVKENPTVAMGRIVHYFPVQAIFTPGGRQTWQPAETFDGQERPAIIVRFWEANGVLFASLLVFLDGSNDPAYRSGPDNSNTLWAPGVPYSAVKEPGSWHWPEDG